MKNLFSYMVIGLISLSSIPAFSAEGGNDGAAVGSGTVVNPVEPKDAPPQGPTGNDPNAVVAPIKNWRTALQQCPGVKVEDVLTKIENGAKKYQQNQENCKNREDKANTFCMESRNPDIKNFLAIAQVLTAGLSGTGIADSCSQFGKVMDMGNKALTSYQTLCSTWRGYCNAACGDAVAGVKAIQANKKELVGKVVAQASAQGAIATNPNAVACKNLASSYPGLVSSNDAAIDAELKVDPQDTEYKAIAKKYETCKGYAKEVASAALGGISMLMSMASANKCDKDTSNTAVATPTPVDCTIAANKQNNMTCICQDAPRTPGCNSGLDSANAAKSADSLREASNAGYTPAANGSNTGVDGSTGDNGMELASKSSDGGGGSLPGAPSGGGGGLGGGSGFGGGASGAEVKKGSGINPNILGGEGGGGGGGGSWGGYGNDKDPTLRQYLPGGAKDPKAGMAGAALSKEVTSQGGKSNWEKVRDRYRDNKPTLLGY
jgi:hypothetical protein